MSKKYHQELIHNVIDALYDLLDNETIHKKLDKHYKNFYGLASGKFIFDIKQKNICEYRQKTAKKSAEEIIKCYADYIFHCFCSSTSTGEFNIKFSYKELILFLEAVIHELQKNNEDDC